MQGKDFLFFLTDKAGRSFYVENDLVQLSATPRDLEYTPKEWQNMLIETIRNQKYFLLDRNFTLPLEAVWDGARILKNQFYKYGFETEMYLVILEQVLFYDGTEYGYYYKSFYKGEIDFTNFNHTGPTVSMNVMEGGIPKIIKAKENIVYEIPLDHVDHDYVIMDGINLKESARFTSVDIPIKKSDFNSYITLPLIFASSDSSQTPGVFFYSPNIESMGSSPFNYLRTSYNAMAMADPSNVAPVILNINGPISYRVNRNDPPLGIALRFYKGTQTAANQNVYRMVFLPAPPNQPGGTYTSMVNFNISLDPGERLFCYLEYLGTTGALDVSISMLPTTDLKITYNFKYKQTVIKALRPLTVFQELIKKATDGQHVPQSNLLQLYDNIRLTSGDGIRGFENAVLKTTISDFYKFIDSHFDAGMGMVSQVLRMEYKGDFVDYSNPIQLGAAAKMSVKPAREYIYNTIISGQKDVTYDNVNGKQEFNSRVQWSTPNTRITRELDRLSPYRQDSYGIEFLRLNLEGKTTTDNSGDNDVFAIHTQKARTASEFGTGRGIYSIDRALNATATGLIEPNTPFNLFLSPARMIHRNGRYIHSLFYKQDAGKIVFQTSDKNKELAAGGIVEKGDIGITGLGKEYFVPIEITIEIPSPDNLMELLEQNPARALQFSYGDLTFRMLPLKVGIKPADREVQVFTGLACPDDNLEQLINIFD